MNIIRFIFPFLFTRNWYNGSWELSRARLALFCVAILLIILGVTLAYYAQAPISYTIDQS